MRKLSIYQNYATSLLLQYLILRAVLLKTPVVIIVVVLVPMADGAEVISSSLWHPSSV
jgi:hypothetical protein